MQPRDHVLAALWMDHHAGRPGRPASFATLRDRVDEAVPEEAIREGLESLVADGRVLPAESTWSLVPQHRDEARAAWEEVSQDGFSTWMLGSQASPTYQRFCREVNGTDIVTFGLIDEAQWAAALRVLALSPGQRALDLGCGIGAATGHIAAATGAHVHGVDFARRAIEWAQQNGRGLVSFSVDTLDRVSPEPGSYDAILAFDTLYFVDDLPRLVAASLRGLKPGGRFVAFHSVGIAPGQPVERLEPDHNPLAKALQAAGQPYTTEDLTAQEHAYWQREKEVATSLEAAFAAEGNQALFDGRIRESSAQLVSCAEGRQRRYLYVATR